ncbi:uncharacterized protein SPAPADRAFT_131594 [Spathaspora passalidarum NRRL Y-27907]|uniref:CUE domain-containing protein n=1 Tax=Spathaspora passalidarum (strain NRRL Y-27907 / 11-Y1) TaxID=619300 RepID=G3AFU8_SPAPN|nr:uncharacterized protein SPAPADRAFT_131594 [Spathaspora passalidarum NRRL Y-27907]EGW35088.1 hypothetical protein SPAPADRAFT_131594 [Spathaspora passalidarum NRRL Y-27907]
MSKKNEKLNVISSEPVESIDETPAKKESPVPAKKESPIPKTDVAKEKHDSTEEVPINESEEQAPVQPPRPVDPIEQITKDLKDAFPNIEDKIITACLIASQGNPDPAFNALLYISDPSFKPEIPAPQTSSSTTKSVDTTKTLTDDELLARKLQKEFELEDDRRRRAARRKGSHPQPKQSRRHSEDFDDSPDEFEQIKETFSQGLEEARTTLNGWVSGIAKKIDGVTNSAPPKVPSKENPKLFGALGGSSFENRRRTTKFDEDPEILTNDFHDKIQLSNNDEGDEHAPPKPARPSTEGKIPQPENEAGKKWQPLESEVPASSDAFLVTDSEDEGDDAVAAAETAPVPPSKT